MNQDLTISITVILFSIINGTLVSYMPKGTTPSVELTKQKTLEEDIHTLLSSLGFSVGDGFIEQLYSQKNVPNGNNVVIVYYMLIEPNQIPTKRLSEWVSVDTSLSTEFDSDIRSYAMQRLRWKVEYTNIVYSLLPKEFTLTELQATYEAILGRVLDKRNFRKKIDTLGILTNTKKKKILGRARPAEIFTFKSRELSFVEIL